jgi:subtilisin family serine protease
MGLKNKWVSLSILFFYVSQGFSQKPGWHNLDLDRDGVFGTSTSKAYSELLKGKHSTKITVAIIDSGVDTAQEDLKSVLWLNPKDGTHGWNYIGPETAKEDITNLITSRRDFYDSLSYAVVPETYRSAYQTYRQLSPQLEHKIEAMKELDQELQSVRQILDNIVEKIGKPNPDSTDFKDYQATNDNEKMVLTRVLRRLHLYHNWRAYYEKEVTEIIYNVEFHLSHGLNLYNNELDTAHGDADVSQDKLGPVKEPNFVAYHGTHVAGLIGATRNNGIGMDGIADNVQIMMLKVNGTIRELRDASLARAIYFAVDHGAKIINLSFGKPYSWNKAAVDNAIKYAMSKDVLLIHAAGNSGENIDLEDHFPNPVYADKSGKAQAWIEVGASGYKNDSTLAASFSNYGQRDVDVFAPGVAIYSTLPYNQYASWDGTSMAAPIVAGIATLIREYYPQLTSKQVKDVLLRSVSKSPYLSDKCASSGVVNTYSALKLAATY